VSARDLARRLLNCCFVAGVDDFAVGVRAVEPYGSHIGSSSGALIISLVIVGSSVGLKHFRPNPTEDSR
jgi:hypothetical protein